MDSQSREEERDLQIGGTIAFRASKKLIARVEATAAAEGISKSDVARRALMRDQQKTAAA